MDFACKKIELEEVVRCSLNLSRADYKLMSFLMDCDCKEFNTKELSKRLKIDLTTAQRSVKSLYEKGIISRLQKNLYSGGYVFVYKIKNKHEIKTKILTIIQNWSKGVEEKIKKW